jgi:hypothetical protein
MVSTENDGNDLVTTHRSVAAAEVNSTSGAELRCRLITGSGRPGTKEAVLHFKKKQRANVPEVLNLYKILSVPPRQKKIQVLTYA